MFKISAMEVLDGDDVRLSSRGRHAERDIVQVRIKVSKYYKKVLEYKTKLIISTIKYAEQCKKM